MTVDLTDEQRGMLVSGLNEWGGPAAGAESLAFAMGFSSLEDLDVGDGERALVVTEIAFASAVLGAAGEWGPIHDGSDSHC